MAEEVVEEPFVGAGLDWLWQLPAVALVGVSALALALVPSAAESEPPPAQRRGTRAALASLAVLVVVLELVPLLAGHALARSRHSAATGRTSMVAP